jgi:hypothetical protein
MSLTGKLGTDLLDVNSLQELSILIENEINTYTSRKEKYSERLGAFLREAETEHGNEDWFKQISLERLGKKRARKRGKKESESWFHFQGMEICSSIQGEAEIMFEAISSISNRLEELFQTKEGIEELMKVGLGNDINYICYFDNGILQKIALKHVDELDKQKFSFNKEFTVIKIM